MKTKLLFIDESKTPTLDNEGNQVFALTGIIITAEKCDQIRSEMLRIMEPISRKNNQITATTKELHGCDLPRDEPDEVKIQVVESIAKLPSEFNLPMYRAGINTNKKFLQLFPEEKSVTSLCWLNLLLITENEYADSYLIPIFDMMSTHDVRRVSQTLNSANQIGYLTNPRNISLNNYQNIITEGLFADSRYSYLIQLVGIISYLRCINDQIISGLNVSLFKRKIWSFNKIIHDMMVSDSVVFFNEKVENRLAQSEYKI